MTREEFEQRFMRDWGLSEVDLERLGIYAVPCYCGGEFPWCSGWQMEVCRDRDR